ncbi:hypothetical protein D3C72_2418850 [compost metagenome]
MGKAQIQKIQQQHLLVRYGRPEAKPEKLFGFAGNLQRDGAQHAVCLNLVGLDPFCLQQESLSVALRVDGQRRFLPLVALEHAA